MDLAAPDDWPLRIVAASKLQNRPQHDRAAICFSHHPSLRLNVCAPSIENALLSRSYFHSSVVQASWPASMALKTLVSRLECRPRLLVAVPALAMTTRCPAGLTGSGSMWDTCK